MDYGSCWHNLCSYGQFQMMQLVPNHPSVHSVEPQLDFDLDLLDCQVPSPCPPSPECILSPTMFSADHSVSKCGGTPSPSPSSYSSAPYSKCGGTPSPAPSSYSS